MHRSKRNGSQKTNAMVAALTLALALGVPLAAAAGTGPTAQQQTTLSAFADGSVSKALSFDAGTQATSDLSLRLPADANVSDAALTARVAGASSASSGALVFDIGADGSPDATASVSVLAAARVQLPPAAVQAYLDGAASATGAVIVPLKVTAAAAAAWTVVLDEVEVGYTTTFDVGVAPTFNGTVADIEVVAGQTNGSAVDLAQHFSAQAGANVTYSAVFGADADARLAGSVRATFDGPMVSIQATDAGAWGAVDLRFAATDGEGQVALSNDVTVHIRPAEPSVAQTWTEARTEAQAVALVGCGSPAPVERIELPDDAVVTRATMVLNGTAGVSLLGATVDVVSGVQLAGALDADLLPREVELNTTALNANLRLQASAFGLVELDLAADVCPTGALSGLTVSGLSVTYTRGAENGTSVPAAALVGVAITGEAGGRVASDTDLEATLEGDLGQDATVTWVLDGEVIAHGAAVSKLSLSQGEHVLEVRAESAASVETYRRPVNATPREGPQAQIAINGLVAGTVESGQELILELRTTQPLDAQAQVEWFVDGALVGHGQVVAGVSLEAGVHTVEARESSNGTFHTYTAEVTVAPASAGPEVVPLVAAVGAVAALAVIAGVAAARRRR